MRKITFVSAPLSSTRGERDEVANWLARFGASAVVLTEDWKLSTIDVDPGFDPSDPEDVLSNKASDKLEERARSFIVSSIQDLAKWIGGRK